MIHIFISDWGEFIHFYRLLSRVLVYDTSVLIKIKKEQKKEENVMMCLFMVVHSIEHTLIFESYSLSLFILGCSLVHLSLVVHWVYISLSSYVRLLRAFHSLDHLCYAFGVVRVW